MKNKCYWNLNQLRIFVSMRMITAFIMGIASGIPVLLTTGAIFQAWLKESGISLGTIGLFAMIGLPYTIKFSWAPFLDHFTPIKRLGRRRSWLLLIQISLTGSIIFLGFTDPAYNLSLVILVGLIVTFLSASQDVIIDAYRRESLSDNEQGLGASLYVSGYRLGLLISSGIGLILADIISFSWVYWIVATIMLFIGITITLICKEPIVLNKTTYSLHDAVIQPFINYFSRPSAWQILFLLITYKAGEIMASQMTIPFYLELGFSKTEIGVVVKLCGSWAMVIGGLLGGTIIMISTRCQHRNLLLFGILQTIGMLGLLILVEAGYNITILVITVMSENIFSGMATTAYLTLISNQTDKRFTATQYAFLSSVVSIPKVFICTLTGYLAAYLGWRYFFLTCIAATIPSLVLITLMIYYKK